MSRDLADLETGFRVRVEELLASCEQTGYEMKPFFTLRTPFEQGKLWRQSRAKLQVEEKVSELRRKGADFLAHCIESAGSQNGRYVTNAIPGLSWHQWGEAIDCFWLVNGRAEWSTRLKIEGVNGYANYANIADSMGLDAGGLWRSFKDWPHVQLRGEASPTKVYSLEEINCEMEIRFGNNA
jgi:hypothetical protein